MVCMNYCKSFQAKCPELTDESNGISIQNIGGVFIIILTGIILSIITLAIEYCYYSIPKLIINMQTP
uniref:Uncharacterized protein n=1 Tax=Heterorhabditis bacteriophora TaxID=37862 RepID=A0A1I7W8A1_HETBA